MITVAYIRMMAGYNAAMNERLYAAAAGLSDAARRADRGAFWRSIHGTLSHLLWADRMWMSRLAGWEAPPLPLRQSDEQYPTFAAMAEFRRDADGALHLWSEGLEDRDLDGNLVWFSGATQREITAPRAKVMVHVFNHQTHHRGQVHAMLTACGAKTGDTDLLFIIP